MVCYSHCECVCFAFNAQPPVQHDTVAEPAIDYPLLPSTPPPAIQQEEQQPEFPEEVVTARDICQSLAITYDVTTVKDLKKLPLRVQPDWARNRCAELLELELVAEPVAPTLLGVNDCAQLKEAYQVVRANNWGGLPVSMYGVWIASKCDELLANRQQPQPQQQEPGPAVQPTNSAPQEPQEQQSNTDTGSEAQAHEPEQKPDQQEQSEQEDQQEEEEEEAEEEHQQQGQQPPLSATGGISAASAARCKDMMVKYDVQPGGKSWGSMSQSMRNYWKSLKCEQWYWSLVLVSCCCCSTVGGRDVLLSGLLMSNSQERARRSVPPTIATRRKSSQSWRPPRPEKSKARTLKDWRCAVGSCLPL